MKSLPLIIGAIVLIIGVGYMLSTQNNELDSALPTNNDSMTTSSESQTPATNETAAENDSANERVTTTQPGMYQEYDADRIANSDAEHVVLFFHATWCPSCRALDKDIIANASNIPSGVEIYKLDFDTATEVKREYGVVRQHSVIVIDANGSPVSNVFHPLTFEQLLSTF